MSLVLANPATVIRSGSATRPAWDIHVVADSDSRWKWGAALARRLVPDVDVRVHATLLQGRSTPNDRQLRDVGLAADSLHRARIGDLIADLSDSDARIVVLACVGGSVQALLHALGQAWRGRPNRPLVVTGYVGLVYERVVDGVLLRAGADVLLANSAADADRFRDILHAVGADPTAVVRTSLPFLGGPVHDLTAAGRTRPFTVTFVTQPGVPESRSERRYALRQVIDHATRHPGRRVIVKLRGRPGERTTHVEPYHYSSLVPARRIPANVEWAYGSMSDVLDETDLCVTVSSTAAIEAMHRGIPTAIITDFGIRESLGNQMFLHSGAFTSWRALHDAVVPETDPGWAARNGVCDTDPYGAAARRVADLLDRPGPRPPLLPWLTQHDAGGYLPNLLARHGVDESGVPLSRDSRGIGDTPWSRRVLRAVALRAYQVGVRSLEPRIKRLAQL